MQLTDATPTCYGDPANIPLPQTLHVVWTDTAPVANFQFRPEVRWDHSDKDAFNGVRDQFTLGVGVAWAGMQLLQAQGARIFRAPRRFASTRR